MNQTIQAQLKDWAKKNNKSIPKTNIERRSEELSESDIKELMGTGRPIYRRYRGSFRQR